MGRVFKSWGGRSGRNLQRLEGCDVPALPRGLHPCHMLWICVEFTCRQMTELLASQQPVQK